MTRNDFIVSCVVLIINRKSPFKLEVYFWEGGKNYLSRCQNEEGENTYLWQ